MQNLVDYLEEALHSSGNEENALQMKAYMKGRFNYYGIKSPERRKLLQEGWKLYKLQNINECYEFVSVAWRKEEREWQYIALDILNKFKRHFQKNTISFAHDLITTKSWWDTVDGLASNVVGPCFVKFPDQRDLYINQWMDSGNMWLQRTCLIFQLKYKEKTDWKLMQKLILALQNDKEFFIRKASGWALRQYSKTNPQAVKTFIDENPQLPSLVIKEGSKYV